jgi:hypothetical protein
MFPASFRVKTKPHAYCDDENTKIKSANYITAMDSRGKKILAILAKEEHKNRSEEQCKLKFPP